MVSPFYYNHGIGQLPTGDGGNLGYNGISPSLVVQFDTYRDNPIIYPDNKSGRFFPYYDHVGLMKNGSCNHETVMIYPLAIFSNIYRC